MTTGLSQFPVVLPPQDRVKRILYQIKRSRDRQLYTAVEMPRRRSYRASQDGSLNPRQEITISSGDLSSSNDPRGNPVANSVLTTSSENPKEFNWKAGDRESEVYLNPGDGVPPHPVIIDLTGDNIRAYTVTVSGGVATLTPRPACRPYGTTGTKLQFGMLTIYNGKIAFQPTSIAIGTVAFLEQLPKNTGRELNDVSTPTPPP
jgi:hypothetical protein